MNGHNDVPFRQPLLVELTLKLAPESVGESTWLLTDQHLCGLTFFVKVKSPLTQELPKEQLEVTYNDKCIEPGQELTPSDSSKAPNIRWKSVQNKRYTLLVIDPDPPSRKAPFLKEMLSAISSI